MHRFAEASAALLRKDGRSPKKTTTTLNTKAQACERVRLDPRQSARRVRSAPSQEGEANNWMPQCELLGPHREQRPNGRPVAMSALARPSKTRTTTAEKMIPWRATCVEKTSSKHALQATLCQTGRQTTIWKNAKPARRILPKGVIVARRLPNAAKVGQHVCECTRRPFL